MIYNDLVNILKDTDRIISTENINRDYFTDGLKRIYGEADVLVFPVNTEEVSCVLKYAYKSNIKVTPRGSGTGLVGGTVPTERGIILDLSKMNKIINLDKSTFTVEVESGVVLNQLQQYVENEGLFYPPDPGEKTATIGGNISTNAGGMRAVKYGVTRDYVRKLEVVLANGTILNLGGDTIKNSSGLDLKDLFIGSEGTLGVITKAFLKVIPKPKKSISAIIAFDALELGIESVNRIINENINATAIEFMEKKVIENTERYLNLKLPCSSGNSYLLLTFDGETDSEIELNSNKAKEVSAKSGAVDFILLKDKEEINNTWQIRGALVKAVEAISEEEPVDIVVPIDKIVEFIDFTKILEEKYKIQVISFGHAGDGNIHLCVVRNGIEESLWREKSHKLLKELYCKCYELNGVTSGEHGIGISKKEYFLRNTNNKNIEYMREIKKVFDDKFILNNNKVYIQ